MKAGARCEIGIEDQVATDGLEITIARDTAKQHIATHQCDMKIAVNLSDIDERFEAGTVSIDELKGVGLVPRRCACIKVLGGGEVTKKFVVKADLFSASAKEKIEKAGGRVELSNA